MEKCKVGSLTIVIRFNKTDYSEIHETIFAKKKNKHNTLDVISLLFLLK